MAPNIKWYSVKKFDKKTFTHFFVFSVSKQDSSFILWDTNVIFCEIMCELIEGYLET